MDSENNNNIPNTEEETPEVTVSFTLTKNDVYMLQKNYFNTKKLHYVLVIALSLMLSTIISSLLDTILSPGALNIFFRLLIIAVVFVFMLFLFNIMFKIAAKRQYKQDKDLRRNTTYRIYKNKITYNSETGSFIKYIDELYKFSETKDYFFIYLTQNKAYILPKKYFKNDNDIEKARKLFLNIPQPKKSKILKIFMWFTIIIFAILVFILIIGFIYGESHNTQELLNILPKHFL